MRPAGVWGFLVALSSSQCGLQWVAASQLPGASQTWEANTQLQTNNSSIGEGTAGEAEAPQQRSTHASNDAAENVEENGGDGTATATSAPVEAADSPAGQAAAAKRRGSTIAQPKNVAIGVSLLLLFFAGLMASTRKKEEEAPPIFKVDEQPEETPLTPEEERQQRLERMQLVSANAERIALAIGSPEASGLNAGVQQNVREATNAESESQLKAYLDSANEQVKELHELAREYANELVKRHSTSPAFPVVAVKEEDEEIPLLQLADKFDNSTFVRCAAKAMRSLQEKSESDAEFVLQLGEHLAGIPTYEDEKDRARFHQMANGIEYLKFLAASQSRDQALGLRLRDGAVESLQVLMSREMKGAILNFEGDFDLLKISMAMMKKRHPPPGIEHAEYMRAISSLEKRLSDMQGAAAEMHAHLEELQRSRSLQAAFQVTTEFGKTLNRAIDDIRALWKHAEELDIGFDIVGTDSKDLIPDKIIHGYDTISPEAYAVQDLIREVTRRIEKVKRERSSVSGETEYELNPNIPSDMISTLQGVETLAEGTLRKAREQMQAFSYMVGPQDVPEYVAEYQTGLLTLNRARLGVHMVHLEVMLFSILGDELKRQVEEAGEAEEFMFPEGSPLAPKMTRLKSRFDESISQVMKARTITNVEESLSKSRSLLDAMNNLIRESLMRNMH